MIKIKVAQFAGVVMTMLLGIGTSNAEIYSVVKDVGSEGTLSGFSLKETPCFVREPTFFGNGGASPLSGFFTEAGINVSKDETAPCVINYRGFVTVNFKGVELSKVFTLPVDMVFKQQDELPDVGAAIQGEPAAATDKLADDVALANKPKSTVGESAGAQLGSSIFNSVGGTVAGAFLGSLADDKKAKLPAGIGFINAEIAFKGSDGKPAHMKIEVHSASTTKERPVDLLRAAVIRLVSEIKGKADAFKKADTANVGATATVTLTVQEVHQ